MARDPKIVAISSAEQAVDKFDPNRPSNLPSPLLPVRKLGLEFLKKSLTELFDNADDSLFEMADRAGSNTEQSLFFEAMRAVRLQRHNITKSCCMAFMRELEALSKFTPEAPPQALQNFEIDSLSLVQPDELEETVAIDNMIGRVASRTKPALSHLSIRLNSLVKVNVDERSNPFGPKMLSQVFVDALAELSLDIKVRLIIYKLFERYVFNQLDAMYDTANRQLISAGVLPDLRGTAQQSAARRGPSAPSGAQYGGGPAVESAEHQQVLSMFSELIGNWRHASGDAAISRLGSPTAEPLRSNELLGMLSNLSFNENQNPAEPVQRIDMRAQINQLLTQHRELSGQARGLERVDDDVISLVSMLFDFILDDPELPSAVKVLIGRLQLPILRVAIADKRFFSQSSHPARRLLNELARATMGWNDHDDLRRDQLHAMLEGIVERLHGQAEPNPELFASLHTELTGFINVEKRRSERLEQRTRDSEEGKARIEAARNQVAASLNALLLGKTLPVFVIDFLRDTWSQVMQMSSLREGQGSVSWKSTEETARRLLESIEPLADDSFEEREALNTQVRQALAQGLKLIGMRSEQGAPLLMRLKQLQQAIITMPELEPDPQSVPLLTEALSEQADKVESPFIDVAAELAQSVEQAESATAEEPLPVVEPDTDQSAPVVADHAPVVPEPVKPVVQEVAPSAPVRPAPVIERVLVDEPVMEAAEPEAAPELVGDLPDAKATEWVAALHTGSWFELAVTEGEPVQRCKLAAIISFSGKYIFVNRTGMKVAEFSTAALGQHFVAGLIRVLDDNQLFDRALESVIGNLRRIQSGKN